MRKIVRSHLVAAATAALVTIVPGASSALDLGVGVGIGSTSAGVGASIGGGGISAGAGASIGGGGISAGAGASIGGGAIDADVGASIGDTTNVGVGVGIGGTAPTGASLASTQTTSQASPDSAAPSALPLLVGMTLLSLDNVPLGRVISAQQRTDGKLLIRIKISDYLKTDTETARVVLPEMPRRDGALRVPMSAKRFIAAL